MFRRLLRSTKTARDLDSPVFDIHDHKRVADSGGWTRSLSAVLVGAVSACLGLAVLSADVKRPRPSGRDIDSLIRDIADHKRDADYEELLRRLPDLQLFLPLVGPLPEGVHYGEKFQVSASTPLRIRTASNSGRNFVLAFTTKTHSDLGSTYAAVEGREALQMTLRIPGADGLAVQSAGTAWVAVDREKVASLLAASRG